MTRYQNTFQAARLTCLGAMAAAVLLVGCSTAGQPVASQISEAEYRSAVDAAAQCMRRAGFEVGELQLEPNGWRWSFSLGGLGAGASDTERSAFDARMDTAYEECMKEHVGGLENAYRRSRIVPAEQRAAVMEKFLACARQAGVDTLEASDSEEAIETKLSRVEGDVYPKVELCRQQFEGLWPQSIPA